MSEKTDIVERLRQRHKLAPLGQSVFSEAADEIERLRAVERPADIVSTAHIIHDGIEAAATWHEVQAHLCFTAAFSSPEDERDLLMVAREAHLKYAKAIRSLSPPAPKDGG